MTNPIGRLDLVALDCPDPAALAAFYQPIVGGEIVPGDSADWYELRTPTGTIAFQRIDDHRAPTWPAGDVPQQAHIDIDVDDLDAAETATLQVGGLKAAVQPRPEEFRVFIDPAGHPFCLVDARFS